MTGGAADAGPAHVVVTGAAGAIGGALARELRAAWPRVALALVDLDRAPLEQLARELGDASVHAIDLREVDALPGWIDELQRARPIDGLVNCAGVMRVQHLGSWRWDDASALLAIDLLAPLRLQDLVVRGILARASGASSASSAGSAGNGDAGWRGTIVNVASMAGRVPLRGCAYYGAAKAGLGMASEVARADLAAHGIRVVTVYPGPVRSALEQGAREAYGGGGLLGRIAPTGDPRELARKIVHAIERDEPRVIYPGLYGVGWTAPNLSRWLALSYGPPPIT